MTILGPNGLGWEAIEISDAEINQVRQAWIATLDREMEELEEFDKFERAIAEEERPIKPMSTGKVIR
jgi:phosphoketolase